MPLHHLSPGGEVGGQSPPGEGGFHNHESGAHDLGD
jgi:hypothetical protein